MDAEFCLVDVFSDQPFGGNQLAVFPRAEGLSAPVMQQLAREFNFAETTFVVPAKDPGCAGRVRIFTPQTELPFAGHPTVGTAAVMASLDPSTRQFVFEEGIGPVTVTAEGPAWRLILPSPGYETTPDGPSAAAVALALSLPDDAIVRCWYAGIGLRFCFVQLTDAALVDKAALDTAAWTAGVSGGWSPHLYVFSGDFSDGGRLYARFFAPSIGIAEDPATGSACATLAASLAYGSPQAGGSYRLRIDQGVAMGRPSVLDAAARKEHGKLAEASVGGHATVIGRGTITIPGPGDPA
jgi:trans-2,3-dihydro-3-hydroxyanthranilate isomerase